MGISLDEEPEKRLLVDDAKRNPKEAAIYLVYNLKTKHFTSRYNYYHLQKNCLIFKFYYDEKLSR